MHCFLLDLRIYIAHAVYKFQRSSDSGLSQCSVYCRNIIIAIYIRYNQSDNLSFTKGNVIDRFYLKVYNYRLVSLKSQCQ